MLFITNRKPVGSIRTKLNRTFKFDLKENAPSNSIYFCKRNGNDEYIEIGSKELMNSLKKSEYQQLLFYIHGFSNLPEPDIFPRTESLQKLFDEKEHGLVKVIPLIWPCDNDLGIIKDYWDDQKSADISAHAFARFLNKFLEWRDSNPDDAPCLKRINILAHSMGNRVFRETLRVWNKDDMPDGLPLLFRNSFLIAADIINESLETEKSGHLISDISRNVSVYFASDDLALRASKVSNLKNKIASRRLGHDGPEKMSKVKKNVYAIDCDDINNSYDFPKGHSYFAEDGEGNPGVVFEHIFNSIKTGRVKVDDKVKRTHIIN